MAVLPTLFVLFACTWISSSSMVVFVRTDNGLSGATLDPFNGTVSCLTPYTMPATQGTWNFGSGTRGQTSATFPMNQTYFFVAQEKFNNGSIGRTILSQGYGPWGPSCYNGRSFVLAPLHTTSPLESLNVAWDHTCNVVVLVPEVGADSRSIITKQVSEYDGQVRPQVDYLPPTGGSYWTKVDGLGALDAGNYQPSWPSGQEWNCGDSCTMYTLEQSPVSGAPRVLIGKSFRTGKLVTNETDSLQLQTLSWSPFGRYASLRSSQFVGIGVCSSAEWAHPSCKGIQGHSVLALFDVVGKKFTVLADIGDHVDPDTVRMGVEFNQMFSRGDKHAFVFYQGSVVAYTLTLDPNSGSIVKATKTSTSPKVNYPVQYWFAGRQ